MSRVLKGVTLLLLILSFFCVMSRIDYIVHATLYDYGLRFSYEWAIGYWITYNITFLLFSIIVSFSYWFGSGKTARDLKISVALLVTISALMIGGLQDILFFVLWAGGLPPNNVVWWWAPWRYILGTWTSVTQISFTILMICGSAFTWTLVIRK